MSVEALEMADALMKVSNHVVASKCAAKMRRMHAHIEVLKMYMSAALAENQRLRGVLPEPPPEPEVA